MSCLFGPVPSRRLGLSLGVDLVPYKVCSYNCIYCEVGETTNLTLERKEYVSFEEVKRELGGFLSSGGAADYITFSGFGEPTLNSKLGEVARWIRAETEIPIALLTNASLFWREDVREEASLAHVVLPSLDAVTHSVFREINRPHPDLEVKRIVEGLILFSKGFEGEIWLEILMVKGVNDQEEEVERLAEVVKEIAPHKIQLNTVVRPPAEPNTYPLTFQEMEEIAKRLPGKVEIVGSPTDHSALSINDLDNSVLETVLRRPCTVKDLIKVTGASELEVKTTLKSLILQNRVEGIKIGEELFYKGKM